MERTSAGRQSWKTVAEHLKEGIRDGRFPTGSKLPSEAELMRDLTASKMTVHRALRELAVEGVVERIERVGTFVRAAKTPASRKLGLILPTNEGFLEMRLMAGVREASGEGTQVVLYSTDEDPVLEAEALARVRNEVDGALILPTCHFRNSQRLERLHQEGFPILCVDRVPTNVEVPGVTTNNYGIAREGLERLADQGHRRMAYLGLYDPKVSSLVDRHRAFRDFTADRLGLSPAEFTRFVTPLSGAESYVAMNSVEDAVLRLTSGDDPVTLVFCANEYYLSTLAEAARRLPKEKVPEILSFLDWPHLTFSGLRVHTIRQDAHGIGTRAARLLDNLIHGRPVEARYEVSASLTLADEAPAYEWSRSP